MWDRYLMARTIDDALEKLASFQGQARLIAGGTDLVLQAQRGQCPSRVMVDITGIPGLDRIYEQDGWIHIGAAATHAQVAASSLICRQAAVLARACGSVGSPQIRNVGTLVGNVVNALPAADGAVALFALNAQAEVATLKERTWLPISDLYENVGVCTIDPCVQMVTALRFRPLSANAGTSFQRLARRQALALPMLNVAVVLDAQNGVCVDARIVVGPVAPTPWRAVSAEQYVIGRPVADTTWDEAARLAMAEAHPRSSPLRGSAEYRTAMVEALVGRGLREAAGPRSER